jgi:hypothetical protein
VNSRTPITILEAKPKKEATNAEVVQDKAPPSASPAQANQPVTALPSLGYRPKHHGSENRQKVHMSTRVPPHVRLAYIEIAKQRGGDWTPSSVLAEAAEEWLEQRMGERFAARVCTMVEQTIDRNYQKRDNRLASLLAKIFYSMELFRLLFIRFMKMYLGKDKMVDDIVTDEEAKARDNIKKDIGKFDAILPNKIGN